MALSFNVVAGLRNGPDGLEGVDDGRHALYLAIEDRCWRGGLAEGRRLEAFCMSAILSITIDHISYKSQR
jgi:hypothetical protein